MNWVLIGASRETEEEDADVSKSLPNSAILNRSRRIECRSTGRHLPYRNRCRFLMKSYGFRLKDMTEEMRELLDFHSMVNLDMDLTWRCGTCNLKWKRLNKRFEEAQQSHVEMLQNRVEEMERQMAEFMK
ncbi:uncharacterized protein LOC110940125 [Helianthus annuus]|uniref:uncharacterized protein LOC110940125 n=1 Tax=Helianthus annuus TaxID=4232 RepID=UPI000B900A93|nr:uncharacterized protein LOC110940125 [Helianthus annuus]XP_035846583.1 uncharacterized protein LOC110940125 [Helianthus annuus]